jgi:fibronectin type 3 domain-containing protein
VTIAAGQSVPFTVSFAPQTAGVVSGNISFASNAPNSPTSEAESGTGATIQHTVDLSWTDSSSGIAGYNVYRSTTAGGPYTKINASLNPSTGYADGSVQSGQTYFYVTTAVDSGGTESAYSNQVTAQVPLP